MLIKHLLIPLCLLLPTLVNAKTLNFATEATYPPFVAMNAANEVIGFEADIVRALCKVMKSECTIKHQPWEGLITGVRLGKYDAVFGGMEITEERKKQVAFTEPTYLSRVGLLMTNNLSADSINHLNKQTIAVQRGTTFAQYAQKYYAKNNTVRSYNSMQEALLDLTTERITVVLGDAPVLENWLAEKGRATNYQFVELPIAEEAAFGEGYGIAVSQKNQALLAELNAALQTIKDNGTYDTIYQQYF